ncbi:IS1 family transposase [Solemya velesiana gill symbiont]|uniref:IS1 family transposase n=1 Tax=Solemya velesiana gill symbiont TaxID=1918948 RepID=UPI0010841C22|nr:IS1 family transposase [Solemya velesiana gill symbiont]
MPKKSSRKNHRRLGLPRIPIEINGVQVNFCKNPRCSNFGIPARSSNQPLKTPDGKVIPDRYRKSGDVWNKSYLLCKECGETPPIKSNLAISEELNRMIAGNEPRPEAYCPTAACKHHNIPVSKGRGFYRRYGKTEGGSIRFLCHGCGKVFSVRKKSTARQRQSHKNRRIFQLLVNRSPLKLESMREINPGLTDQMICNLLAQEQVASMSPHGKWNDLWFMHPLPDMTEPEKAICHLTDMSDYSVEHRANLYLSVSKSDTQIDG